MFKFDIVMGKSSHCRLGSVDGIRFFPGTTILYADYLEFYTVKIE